MLKCTKCKKDIPDASTYCMYCGKKIPSESAAKHAPRTRGNGTGTAFRHGNGWAVEFTQGYHLDPKTGKMIRKRIRRQGFKTKKEALAAVPKLAAIPWKVESKITLSALYDKWYDSYEGKVGSSTMDCYKAAWKYFAPIQHVRFVDLSSMQWQECINACGKGKRTKQNMKCLASLLYQYAMLNDICSANKAAPLDIGRDEQKKYPALDLCELEKVKASDELYAPYVVALCYTGCRPNELFKIRKDMVDVQAMMVRTGSKTAAGKDRLIPFSPKIHQIIRTQMQTPGPWLFPCLDAGKRSSNGKVIGAKGGEQMTPNHFQDCFSEVMDALGIVDRVPYSCRHTFSNLLKVVDGSDTDKAALMGHAEAYMTKYYQEEDIASLTAIINRI